MNIEKQTDLDLIDEMKDFNNFYLYLPGGRYREFAKDNPEYQKIIDDIDKIAQEMSIDTALIYNKISSGCIMMMKAINLAGENLIEAERIRDEADILRTDGHKMLVPIFKAMAKKGYKVNKLVT